MNYLAHLHLAQFSQTSLPGALLGEYVKGTIDPQLPARLQQGVWLHRRVDSFTDVHPLHAGAVRTLPSPFRRYGGIIMDMMFDHFLARHWSRYHDGPLNEFIKHAHAQLLPDEHWPTAMKTLVDRMQHYQLLASYRTLDGVSLAIARIDHRFRRPTPLPHCGPLLQEHYADMEQAFLDFYPDLMAFAIAEVNKHQAISHNE